MILFADNDILLKLTGCNLLLPFLEALTLTDADICLTSDAKYSLARQAQKKLATDEAARSALSVILGRVKYLEQAIDDANGMLDLMAPIDGLDGGESLLFLAAGNAAADKLATGDKRALRTLCANTHIIAPVHNGLRGKVFTLESTLLLLMERLGFALVSERVCGRSIPDRTLDLAYGPDRSIDHAIDCLSSEARPFLELLATPELIRPLE